MTWILSDLSLKSVQFGQLAMALQIVALKTLLFLNKTCKLLVFKSWGCLNKYISPLRGTWVLQVHKQLMQQKLVVET